uniref:Uncharacterized protein n=1 Tax=viral metagenome TaxID=1070528 RepID=A0A6C0IE04_9ZZZZ
MTLCNDVINDLQYYILDDNNIKKALEMNINNNVKNNIIQKNDKTDKIDKKQTNENNFFFPKEKDTLFWCFYIIKNGDVKYDSIYHKNEVLASQIKIEYVEKIRKEKQTVKTYKFDTISNIESNLANDKILNIKTFLTLCAIENINILYTHNKTYYELLTNDTDNIFIVNSLDKGIGSGSFGKKYGYQLNTKDYANNIKSSLYKLDNIDKPLKAISYYKVEDLIKICNKLVIETINKQNGKEKLKKELYEAIIQYF